MLTNIVDELLLAHERDQDPWDATIYARAAAEIVNLRIALTHAVGELSTYPPYADMSPETLLRQFLETAKNV